MLCSYFFRLFDGLEPIFYPMVWFETYTELDDETASLMKFLAIAPKLGIIIGSIMIGIGFLTTLAVVLSVMRNKSTIKKRYV